MYTSRKALEEEDAKSKTESYLSNNPEVFVKKTSIEPPLVMT